MHAQAFEDGFTKEQLFDLTNIDPWFLSQFEGLHQTEEWLRTRSLTDLSAEDFLQTKKRGFSDPQIARAVGATPCPPCAFLLLLATCTEPASISDHEPNTSPPQQRCLLGPLKCFCSAGSKGVNRSPVSRVCHMS